MLHSVQFHPGRMIVEKKSFCTFVYVINLITRNIGFQMLWRMALQFVQAKAVVSLDVIKYVLFKFLLLGG